MGPILLPVFRRVLKRAEELRAMGASLSLLMLGLRYPEHREVARQALWDGLPAGDPTREARQEMASLVLDHPQENLDAHLGAGLELAQRLARRSGVPWSIEKTSPALEELAYWLVLQEVLSSGGPLSKASSSALQSSFILLCLSMDPAGVCLEARRGRPKAYH
jgi:hypothetical protein